MNQPLPYCNPQPSRGASVFAWISIGVIAHVLASYGTIVVALLVYGVYDDLLMYVLAPVFLPIEVVQFGRSHYTWREWSVVVGSYVPVFCTSFFYLFPKPRR